MGAADAAAPLMSGRGSGGGQVNVNERAHLLTCASSPSFLCRVAPVLLHSVDGEELRFLIVAV